MDKVLVKDEGEKEEIIKVVYDNPQNWVRHYNSIIVQINSLAIGGSAAIVAYFISNRWSGVAPPKEFVFLLMAPLAISGFALWSTYTIAHEMQTVFRRMIQIEKHWKIYGEGESHS